LAAVIGIKMLFTVCWIVGCWLPVRCLKNMGVPLHEPVVFVRLLGMAYAATDGHGGILARVGEQFPANPTRLTFVPTRRHTAGSAVNVRRLPASVWGRKTEWSDTGAGVRPDQNARPEVDPMGRGRRGSKPYPAVEQNRVVAEGDGVEAELLRKPGCGQRVLYRCGLVEAWEGLELKADAAAALEHPR